MEFFQAFMTAQAAAGQQRQIVQSVVAQAEQERARQRELENKRALIKEINQNVSQFVQDALALPQQTLLCLRILMSDAVWLGLIPDAFQEQIDKEDVVLLWRRIQNLHERLVSKLTQEAQTGCQAAVDAVFKQRFIQYAAPRIDAYEKMKAIEAEWQAGQGEKKHILAQRQLLGAGFPSLAVFAILIYSLKVGLINAVSELGVILFIAVIAGFIAYYGWRSERMEQCEKLDRQHQQHSAKAELNDQDFWSRLQEAFGGIPAYAELPQLYQDQEPIIQAVIGK